MYNKEEIYDKKISPLMAEIIKICKDNNVAMFASFALKPETDESESLYCSTKINSSEHVFEPFEKVEKVLSGDYDVVKNFHAFVVSTTPNPSGR
jgi:hypothetical protein